MASLTHRDAGFFSIFVFFNGTKSKYCMLGCFKLCFLRIVQNDLFYLKS